MLSSKSKFEVDKIFLAKIKNIVVYFEDWPSNISKQNSSARRFNSSALQLKCDSILPFAAIAS